MKKGNQRIKSKEDDTLLAQCFTGGGNVAVALDINLRNVIKLLLKLALRRLM